MKEAKILLLSTDPHDDWLEFSMSALSTAGYDVVSARGFDTLFEVQRKRKEFGLVIITSNSNHERTTSRLARPSGHLRRFIMLSPDTSNGRRILMKAGAVDLIDKPYAFDALLEMVDQELPSARQSFKPHALLEMLDQKLSSARQPLKSPVKAGTLVRLTIEQQVELFDDEQQRKLIERIASCTRVPKEGIRLVYVIPGSVLVTLEMPEDGALKLMTLYLHGSAVISELGINKVELRPVPPRPAAVSKLPAQPSRSEVSIDYEHGLRQMHELLMDQPHLQSEFHTLEARLLDYLKDEQWFGVSETAREGRARVISSLNDLAVRVDLASSFVDLCRQR